MGKRFWFCCKIINIYTGVCWYILSMILLYIIFFFVGKQRQITEILEISRHQIIQIYFDEKITRKRSTKICYQRFFFFFFYWCTVKKSIKVKSSLNLYRYDPVLSDKYPVFNSKRMYIQWKKKCKLKFWQHADWCFKTISRSTHQVRCKKKR